MERTDKILVGKRETDVAGRIRRIMCHELERVVRLRLELTTTVELGGGVGFCGNGDVLAESLSVSQQVRRVMAAYQLSSAWCGTFFFSSMLRTQGHSAEGLKEPRGTFHYSLC
jgi:hypothetical protein